MPPGSLSSNPGPSGGRREAASSTSGPLTSTQSAGQVAVGGQLGGVGSSSYGFHGINGVVMPACHVPLPPTFTFLRKEKETKAHSRNSVAHKAEKIHCLAVYRKSP